MHNFSSDFPVFYEIVNNVLTFGNPSGGERRGEVGSVGHGHLYDGRRVSQGRRYRLCPGLQAHPGT